jgi:hypothetical protein
VVCQRAIGWPSADNHRPVNGDGDARKLSALPRSSRRRPPDPGGQVAAPATVTGTLTIREKVTLSPNAVAVFSIVGQQANSNAGGIVGYQRINNAKTPVEFSVPYDTTAIDQKQSARSSARSSTARPCTRPSSPCRSSRAGRPPA